MKNRIEVVRDIAQQVLRVRAVIGDGTEDDDLSNIFLESAPETVMTGQAYENLATAYHALTRAYETMIDIAGLMEEQ